MRTIMETSGGRFFDFEDPSTVQVNLHDLARGLSNTCRFGGHLSDFYSVAEHAVLVRDLVVEAGHADLGLAALHHDSHEAYLGDLPTPLKQAIGPEYRAMVVGIDSAIAEWLGIDPDDFHHPAIVEADQLALRLEAAALKDSQGIVGAWPWRELPQRRIGWEPGLTPQLARHWFYAAHTVETTRRA